MRHQENGRAGLAATRPDRFSVSVGSRCSAPGTTIDMDHLAGDVARQR